MADSEMIHAILQGEVILQVNATRSLYDLHYISEPFLGEFTTALNEAKQWNSAASFAAGDQSGAQDRVDEARARLRVLLRNGYYSLLGVPADSYSTGELRDAQESYGWAGGELGDLDLVERVEALGALAVNAGPQISPALRYPATITTPTNNWLGVLASNKSIAAGGTRMTVIATKDEKRDALQAKLARVRFLYCFANDLGEGNPELERILFPRKRKPGEAQTQPRPDPCGTATWDAAQRLLSVTALPAHATFLVAWRQALGGQPEEAGISDTESVLASQFSPFMPGATYDLWVAGRNSRGDGEASNKVRWTAP